MLELKGRSRQFIVHILLVGAFFIGFLLFVAVYHSYHRDPPQLDQPKKAEAE